MFQFLQQLGQIGAVPNAKPFAEMYRCFPVAMSSKKTTTNLEDGDKLLLPPSALDHLARLKVTYPMMFEVENVGNKMKTHCGVIEFSAEEGCCYMPYWMMQNLLLQTGGMILIKNVTLKNGTFVKLQPHLTSFTKLSNPRVVLEKALRSFTCLTKGQTIFIRFGDQVHELDVVEVRPGTAVSIIETDVNVDFAPPKDFKEEKLTKPPSTPGTPMMESQGSARKSSENFSIGTPAMKLPTESVTSISSTSSVNSNHSNNSNSSTSSGGSYFSRLGPGNSLKASSSASSQRPSSQSVSSASPTIQNSQGGSQLARPATGVPRSFSVSEPAIEEKLDPRGRASSTSSAATSAAVVASGASTRFDYQYTAGADGKARLAKRIPKKSTSSSFKAFAGAGNSLK